MLRDLALSRRTSAVRLYNDLNLTVITPLPAGTPATAVAAVNSARQWRTEAQSRLVRVNQLLQTGSPYVSVLNAVVFAEEAMWAGMGEVDVSYRGDADSDGYSDLDLLSSSASPLPVDSDNDGLMSTLELSSGLSPGQSDSDGDGTPDGEEDSDGDSLTNLDEQALGLSLISEDTDNDQVTDSAEVAAGLDPLNPDTDGDGLADGAELRFATNPLVADSDGDGTPDGLEEMASTVNGPGSVTATAHGQGDMSEAVQIVESQSASGTTSTAGISGKAYTIEVDPADETRLTSATIALPFDPAVVAPENVQLMHFNEHLRLWEPAAATQTVDATAGMVSATVTDFSDFAVFDVLTWAQALIASASECDGRAPGSGDVDPLDVAFVMDSSGSMSSNDPQRQRISSAKAFVDELLSGDRAAVIDFAGSATVRIGLSGDRAAVKSALDLVGQNGSSTNIGAGVSSATQVLSNNGDPTRQRVMIVLTDGIGSYSTSATAAAAAANITIYAIGLGSAPDANLLTTIAAGTGGEYYPVANANAIANVFRRIADETAVDSDADGISDCDEENGMPTASGKTYFSDPANPDSDGDGLLDGEELHVYRLGTISNLFTPLSPSIYNQLLGHPGARYFAATSDPQKVDTDADGRSDYVEVQQGTDPMVPDFRLRPEIPASAGIGQRQAAPLYTEVSSDVKESYALIDMPELRAPGKGVVRIHAFINRFSDGPTPWFNAAGDDRGFDSTAPYWASRAYMEVDHDRGHIMLVVNPSCTVGSGNQLDDCYTAKPIQITGEPGVALTGQTANWFKVDSTTGKVRIRFDLGISIPPNGPNPLVISGFWELGVRADGTVSFPAAEQMRWRGDPYPSWEIYHDPSPGGTPVALYRRTQTNQGPWTLNEYNWWDQGRCLRYQERRGVTIPSYANWIARPQNGNWVGDTWRWLAPGDDLECVSGLWTGW